MMQLVITIFLLVSLSPFVGAQETSMSNATTSAVLANLLSDTPIEEDLQELCDHFGGRVTGTDNNLAAVDWGLKKFEEAGVSAKKEAFKIPSLWIENATIAQVSGTADFTPKVVAKYYSKTTPPEGIQAAIIDVGYGTEDDFERIGSQVQGKFVLVEADLCLDVDGLFKEYADAAMIDARAAKAGAIGMVSSICPRDPRNYSTDLSRLMEQIMA